MSFFTDNVILNKRAPRTFLALIAALGLHALAILGAKWLVSHRPVPIRRPVTTPIKVRIISRSPATAPTIERGQARKEPREATSPHAPAAKPAGSARPMRQPKYAELFPKTFAEEDQERPTPGVEVIPPNVVAATEELAGKFDIPLFFRSQIESAKAVAKLVRQPDGALILDYLDGTPLLRAVLYQGLNQSANRKLIDRWLNSLQTNEIVLTFRLRTIRTETPPSREEETLQFRQGQLTIERIMYIYHGVSGIPLPDAEAERALRRDRSELDRLLTSPGYQSPIRNRRLTP